MTSTSLILTDVDTRRTRARKEVTGFAMGFAKWAMMTFSVITIAVVTAFAINRQSHKVNNLRDEIHRTDLRIRELQKVHSNHYAELERLKDGSNITAKARMRGLMPAGKHQVIQVGADGLVKNDSFRQRRTYAEYSPRKRTESRQ